MKLKTCDHASQEVVSAPPKCVCCGHGELVSAFLVDMSGGGPLRAGVYRKPEAFMFKGTAYSKTENFVCTACGYVHVFVQEPKLLREAGNR